MGVAATGLGAGCYVGGRAGALLPCHPRTREERADPGTQGRRSAHGFGGGEADTALNVGLCASPWVPGSAPPSAVCPGMTREGDTGGSARVDRWGGSARRPPRRSVRPYFDPSYRCGRFLRSEEHTSELQSLMRISYAVFCLKKKNTI